MSNARLFAWGYVVTYGLIAIADSLFESPYVGIISMVGKTLIALQGGFTTVALFGDRHLKEETP